MVSAYPNENVGKDARKILDLLVDVDYPREKLENYPINDFSSDETRAILDDYARRFPFIRPLHRYEGERGKPAALNEAMKMALGRDYYCF